MDAANFMSNFDYRPTLFFFTDLFFYEGPTAIFKVRQRDLRRYAWDGLKLLLINVNFMLNGGGGEQ